jgi:hypothetical protein
MPIFILSTISSLMHDIVYSLICSRTSKGLRLGELIHTFCIIILTWYRSDLHCYLHWSWLILPFLDDLQDFLTKSPPWYLIFGIKKSPIFVFCCSKDLLELKKGQGFLQYNYFIMRSSWRGVSTREEPWGPYEHECHDPLARHQDCFLAPLPRRKRISARGVSHIQSFLLCYCFS